MVTRRFTANIHAIYPRKNSPRVEVDVKNLDDEGDSRVVLRPEIMEAAYEQSVALLVTAAAQGLRMHFTTEENGIDIDYTGIVGR